ncbi:hypothetical protein DPMN_045130 [Dreissena polymorpha]|uniref:Uncharacterized protein n=1 Tax=Dreissena polymorpha TaxID=45954 RepID=A0A9D4D3J6_DREPO|nr:hypothetical protein DPMN_045130 [Dreissena polymorpha]
MIPLKNDPRPGRGGLQNSFNITGTGGGDRSQSKAIDIPGVGNVPFVLRKHGGDVTTA